VDGAGGEGKQRDREINAELQSTIRTQSREAVFFYFCHRAGRTVELSPGYKKEKLKRS